MRKDLIRKFKDFNESGDLWVGWRGRIIKKWCTY